MALEYINWDGGGGGGFFFCDKNRKVKTSRDSAPLICVDIFHIQSCDPQESKLIEIAYLLYLYIYLYNNTTNTDNPPTLLPKLQTNEARKTFCPMQLMQCNGFDAVQTK